MDRIGRCFFRHLHLRLTLTRLDPALYPLNRTFTLSCSVPRTLGCLTNASGLLHTHTFLPSASTNAAIVSSSSQTGSHSWPEWLKLVDSLVSRGYLHNTRSHQRTDWSLHPDDAFSTTENLSQEFLSSARSCLSLSRDRPNLIRSLCKKDIEVLVLNGEPFLFKNVDESKKRLQSFVRTVGTDVSLTPLYVELSKWTRPVDKTYALGAQGFESDTAYTVDLMKYILSHLSSRTIISEHTDANSGEYIESSLRNLLRELDCLVNSTPPENLQLPGSNGMPCRRHQIEMKRGDWICPKCNFMNFARNPKCLECEEARPKRVMLAGEWECPQCDFFNYSKTVVCMRCECERPSKSLSRNSDPDMVSVHADGGNADSPERTISRRLDEILGRTSLTHGSKSQSNSGHVLDSHDVTDGGSVGESMEGSAVAPLDMSEEAKAERWFKRVAQIKDISELRQIPDEDFPSIMPMRKGVNRFVVSKRKTPLERRLTSRYPFKNGST